MIDTFGGQFRFPCLARMCLHLVGSSSKPLRPRSSVCTLFSNRTIWQRGWAWPYLSWRRHPGAALQGGWRKGSRMGHPWAGSLLAIVGRKGSPGGHGWVDFSTWSLATLFFCPVPVMQVWIVFWLFLCETFKLLKKKIRTKRVGNLPYLHQIAQPDLWERSSWVRNFLEWALWASSSFWQWLGHTSSTVVFLILIGKMANNTCRLFTGQEERLA